MPLSDITPTVDSSTGEPTEQERMAATIVLPTYEREAAAARDAADLDEIQDVQDRYHDARMERAARRIKREGESK